MSTKTNERGKSRSTNRKQIRRGRENPSRTESVPVAKWEAEVNSSFQGRDHAGKRRKVVTKGIRRIDVADLFDEVKVLMRQGYEVRLTSENDGDCMRLFPCLDANYERMNVTAQTMGSFREAIADIPFQMSHRGKKVDALEEQKAKEKRSEEMRDARECEHVTPDTMVTCPNCGNEFRVGKRIV